MLMSLTYFLLAGLILGSGLYIKYLFQLKQNQLESTRNRLDASERNFNTLKDQFDQLITYKKNVLHARIYKSWTSVKLADVIEMIDVRLLEADHHKYVYRHQVLTEAVNYFHNNFAYAIEDIPSSPFQVKTKVIDQVVNLILAGQFPPDQLAQLLLTLPPETTLMLTDIPSLDLN